MEKNIFLFDKNKCVGCGACAVACMNENGFQSPEQWRNIHSTNPTHHPHLSLSYLSLACNHCDDSPCLHNCPAKAYHRDSVTGAVIHTAEKCIGCKYCTWACPYDAPKYSPSKGIVEKCTFCNQRILENEKPACANLCPTGALDFKCEEFRRESSFQSSPVPLDVGAHFRSIELRKSSGPLIDQQLFSESPVQAEIGTEKKITARKEWPLVIFSLLVSSIVAVDWFQVIESQGLIIKVVVLSLGGVAGLLSTLHLGQKGKAWRSILNVKGSWLSREIVFFSLFMAGVTVKWLVYPIPSVITFFLGAALLFSIDQLYKLAMWRWPLKIHSAQTLFIGISLFALIQDEYLVFGLIMSLRLGIILAQIIKGGAYPLVTGILRISSIILVLFVLLIKIEVHYIFLLFAIGEITDRIIFYNQLRVPDVKEEICLHNRQ